MENEGLINLLIYVVPAVLCGGLSAYVIRNVKNPRAWVIFSSLLVVPTAMVLGIAMAAATDVFVRVGFQPMQALTAAIWANLRGLAMPICSCLPALCAGLTMQASLQCVHSAPRSGRQPVQFSLRLLLGLIVLAPPLLAAWYFEPLLGIFTVATLLATYGLTRVALVIVEVE